VKKWGWNASGACGWFDSANAPLAGLLAHVAQDAAGPPKLASVTLDTRMLPRMLWEPWVWSQGFISSKQVRAKHS
jgi:hypothetical protein